MQSQQCYHPERLAGDRIEALREEIARLEGISRLHSPQPLSTGFSALDRALPQKGFRRGTIVEWLTAGEGTGATTLALLAARQACKQGSAVVVLDRSKEFYPPAAVRLGIELERLIVVRPENTPDYQWALDQSLRCPAVGAVLAWPDDLGGKLDSRTFRRLQLAAEEGDSLGLLVRLETVRHQPSWADVRLLVEPLPSGNGGRKRRWKILLLRCRGGTEGRSVELEVTDETHSVRVD
jgi:protein ImuA